MNKQEIEQLHNDINKALDEVAEKHGVTMSVNKLRYSKTGFRGKLEGSTAKSPAEIREEERREFSNAITGVHGVHEDDFNREFTSRGSTFVIRKYNTRAKKYPIIAKKKGTDKRYKFPMEVLDMARGQEDKAIA